ncbi:hypothetical protein OBV_02300 [Oscillibacter valericigenes Sjm18-20]|nr:hypothetical protein OBV_02300 [Oscillibacter valericigenes Sjm18-20]
MEISYHNSVYSYKVSNSGLSVTSYIGHIKLSDLRPQYLNSFYQNLGENGIRKGGEYAVARVNIASLLQSRHLSKSALARRAGIAATTISAAVRGASISRKTAELTAVAIEKKATGVFCFERNTLPLSDKTILEYHRLISSIMAQAEKEMLIPYNPAAKATPPKPRRKEPNYFQPDVLDGILDELDHAPLKWRTITYLLIDTGCRRGEAAGLKMGQH